MSYHVLTHIHTQKEYLFELKFLTLTKTNFIKWNAYPIFAQKISILDFVVRIGVGRIIDSDEESIELLKGVGCLSW